MARRKQTPIKGKSTPKKRKSQKKRKKIAPVPIAKKRPTPPKSKPKPRKKRPAKVTAKPVKRKKLKSLSIGRVRQYDDTKPSKAKSTAEKAAILRKIKDLPFKATKKFSAEQIKYIDQQYDGLDGATSFRRLINLKKLKIEKGDKEKYEQSGYVVVEKSYKIKGKIKKGTYVLIYSPHPKIKAYYIKNGMVIKYVDRVEIIINLTTPEVYFFINNPEEFIQLIMDDNQRLFKKYSHLSPVYKIIYPHGESKQEYDDIENLHHYLEKLEREGAEDIIKRIAGIAFIYHI